MSRNLTARVEKLERAMSLEARPLVIWAMTQGRAMTEAEVEAERIAAIREGRATTASPVCAVRWLSEMCPGSPT